MTKLKTTIFIILMASVTGCANLSQAGKVFADNVDKGVARTGEQCGSYSNPCNIRVIR